MENPKSIYGAPQPPPLARRPPPGGFPTATPPVDAYRYHSHRRRRRGRRPKFDVQGWFWTAMLLLLAGYVGYLAYSRRHPPSFAVKPPPPPPPAVASLPPPKLAGVPDAVRIPPSGTNEVKQQIVNWMGARRALTDAADLRGRGQLPEAVLRVRAALERNPRDLDLRSTLAELLFQTRAYEEAVAELLQVLEADPDRLTARQMLAMSYDHLHRHEEALSVVRWMLESDPYALETRELAARICLALGQAKEAVEHLEKVVGVQRENASALNLLAHAQTLQGQYGPAEKTLKQVLKLDDRNSASYYNLAVCRARQNAVTGVVEVLNTAVTMFGAPFVASWTASEEFVPLMSNSFFAAWHKTLKDGPPAGITNGAAGAGSPPAG